MSACTNGAVLRAQHPSKCRMMSPTMSTVPIRGALPTMSVEAQPRAADPRTLEDCA